MSKIKGSLHFEMALLVELPSFLSLTIYCDYSRTMVHGGSKTCSQDLSLNAAHALLHIPFVQVTFPGLCSQTNYLRNKQL